MTFINEAAREFEMGEEWINRRFGSGHAKPCRLSGMVTCAMPLCQIADVCQATDETVTEMDAIGRGDEPPFTLCERTVRACIEALPHPLSWEDAVRHDYLVRDALESLLPKPDRAKELAGQFCGCEFDDPHTDQDYRMMLFARWLINEKGMKL